MYTFKDKYVFKKYNKTQCAKIIGLNPATLIRIANGKQSCSKLVAYCITKFIDSNAEIEDYFTREEE